MTLVRLPYFKIAVPKITENAFKEDILLCESFEKNSCSGYEIADGYRCILIVGRLNGNKLAMFLDEANLEKVRSILDPDNQVPNEEIIDLDEWYSRRCGVISYHGRNMSINSIDFTEVENMKYIISENF